MPRAKKVRQATIYPFSHNLSHEKKEYTVSGGANSHGKFVRLEEMVRGKKNFIFIDPSKAQEICDLIIVTAREIQGFTPSATVEVTEEG